MRIILWLLDITLLLEIQLKNVLLLMSLNII